jgi:NitT/TauT family transport system substrate-binding protein
LKRAKLQITVILTALVLLSLSLYNGACKREVSNNGSTVVRVGLLQHASSIPIIIAQENGYFKKRGLQVELKTVSPDQQMPSLLRGDVDLISPSSFPVIFSTFQQNPGTIQCFLVGGESKTGDTLYGIVVRKDSSFKTLGDLVGKTIGSASKFTTVNLRNVLRYKFHDASASTTIREVTDKSLLLTGLANGSIDAAVVDQPALSSKTIQDEFSVIEKNFRAEYLMEPYWSGAGVAKKDWLDRNADQYNAFLDSLDDALAECAKNPSAAKMAFIRYFDLKDVSAEAIGMYVYPNARHVPPESFTKALMKMLVESQLLASEFETTELFYRR